MPSLLKRLSLICCAVLVVAACRSGDVYNVQSSPLAASHAVTLAQVGQVVKEAGAGLGWVMKDAGPGRMTGTLALRSHVAIVDIAYDTQQFSITYKDSTNLNYDGQHIHSNYNGWIQNLEQAIRAKSSAL